MPVAKRPAANVVEGVIKKPAKWHERLTDDNCAAADADVLEDDGEKDVTSITKQQRHVWDRAAKAGQIPDAVMGEHNRVRTEKNWRP